MNADSRLAGLLLWKQLRMKINQTNGPDMHLSIIFLLGWTFYYCMLLLHPFTTRACNVVASCLNYCCTTGAEAQRCLLQTDSRFCWLVKWKKLIEWPTTTALRLGPFPKALSDTILGKKKKGNDRQGQERRHDIKSCNSIYCHSAVW